MSYHARNHASSVETARMAARDVVVALEDGFDFRSGDYPPLFRSSAATAFQHPLWLAAFYERLAPRRGARKVVVTGRHAATGALLLVLPLILRRKAGVTLLEAADLGVSDYAAPVLAADFHPGEAIARDVLSALPGHDLMRIRPIRAEHLSQWRSLLGGEALRLDFSAHSAGLGPDFTQWRETALDAGFRRRLDRKKKRFLKQPGASVRLLTEQEEIRRAIADIARLRAGRFEGDLIQHAFVEEFYAEVACSGPAGGLARTYSVSLDGEAIGHAFGITHGGRFNYLLIGCDYGRHGRHSPGLVLYDAMIEDWIASGGTIYDFTIGDEPFKSDFATQPTAMYELTSQPTLKGRVAAMGFAARERLRRLRQAGGAGNERKAPGADTGAENGETT